MFYIFGHFITSQSLFTKETSYARSVFTVSDKTNDNFVYLL